MKKKGRQRYRRAVGPVELPKTDAQLLEEARRQARAAKRRGLVIGSESARNRSLSGSESREKKPGDT